MKAFYYSTILAAFLLICNNGILAQKPHIPNTQTELIKQLHSTLPTEIRQAFDENKLPQPQGFENLQNSKILKAGKANHLKFATADGQQLDSVIYENWDKITKLWVVTWKEKEVYEYDANGKIVSYTPYWWSWIDNFWAPYSPPLQRGEERAKIEFQYDQNGAMTSSIASWWCGDQNEYDSFRKEEYSFDVNGNRTSIIKYIKNWDYDNSTSQWIGLEKSEYTYDANSNITLSVDFIWDETISQWIGDWKLEYAFDSSGNRTLEIYYSRDKTFTPYIKIESFYDSIGNRISQSKFSWDDSTSSWVVFDEQENKYEYDASGNKTLEISNSWDITTSQWVVFGKTEYSYDTNNNKNLEVYYSWDKTTEQWIGDYKKEYSYDTNNNKTLEAYYYWDRTTKQLVKEYKYEYSFDANSNKTMEIFYRGYPSIADWVAETKTTWYYSDKSTNSLPNKPAPHLTVYPNPAKDFVVFDLPNSSESATVELYDIQGKKVVQQKLTETKQIAVGHLPKGLYLYRLTDGERFYTGKLVVE